MTKRDTLKKQKDFSPPYSVEEKHGIVTTSHDYMLKKRDLSLSVLKSPSSENVSEYTMTVLHF